MKAEEKRDTLSSQPQSTPNTQPWDRTHLASVAADLGCFGAQHGCEPHTFCLGKLAQGEWLDGEKGQPAAMGGSVLLPLNLFLLGPVWGRTRKGTSSPVSGCSKASPTFALHTRCTCFPRATTQTSHLGVAMSPVPAATPEPETGPAGSQCILSALRW